MQSHKKIGILGGTFNPIHNGHLALAQNAYESLGLDKVLFMPSGNSYMKSNVLDAGIRVEMLKRAIKPFPYFELSLIDVNRAGNTYTSDTLQILHDEQPDDKLYFIIGADCLFQIEEWHDPDIIFSLSTLACAVRDDYNINMLQEKRNELSRRNAHIVFLDLPLVNISSTDIRSRASENLPLNGLVPDAVADYILQEHIYEKN